MPSVSRRLPVLHGWEDSHAKNGDDVLRLYHRQFSILLCLRSGKVACKLSKVLQVSVSKLQSQIMVRNLNTSPCAAEETGCKINELSIQRDPPREII